MITYESIIKRYENHGEKTGWSYIEVNPEVATRLKPNNAKSFRVRGKLDEVPISGAALIPVGGGAFILPINASLRRQLGKSAGAPLHVELAEDLDFKLEVPPEIESTLQYSSEGLFERFMALTPSHRGYFVKYFNEAKTEATQTKRLVMIVEAMELGLDYGAMIRLAQSRNRKVRKT